MSTETSTLYYVPVPYGYPSIGVTLDEAKSRVERGCHYMKRGWTARWVEYPEDGEMVYERVNSRGRVVYRHRIITMAAYDAWLTDRDST